MQKYINPFWDTFYQDLTYEESLFRDAEQVKIWEQAGYHLPSTSILIHQTIGKFKEFVNHFPELKHVGVCIHKLLPGHYLPTHIDRYGFYRQKYNVDDVNKIHRYVVFLENCRDGHSLTVNGVCYNNWREGDCIGWVGETPHSAVNLGIKDRYTLQITGIYEG